MTHFLTIPSLISRAHPGRNYCIFLCIFYIFFTFFLLIFPFYIPSKFCFNVYMRPCAHLGNVRRNLGHGSKDGNFPRPHNKLGTLRPISSLKTENGEKQELCKKICPICCSNVHNRGETKRSFYLISSFKFLVAWSFNFTTLC